MLFLCHLDGVAALWAGGEAGDVVFAGCALMPVHAYRFGDASAGVFDDMDGDEEDAAEEEGVVEDAGEDGLIGEENKLIPCCPPQIQCVSRHTPFEHNPTAINSRFASPRKTWPAIELFEYPHTFSCFLNAWYW